MALQLSLRVRNARLAAIEATIGPGPTLRIRSGAAPANTAASRSGTVLATVALPANWMNDPANAVITAAGSWADSAADNAGTAGHFDITAADATVDCQGTVTATGGGGDMELDNTVFAAGQAFSVTAFSITEPNG